ncbi:hypothetical protein MCNS_47520 [Mycobacterium conspicuum]|uniref:Uncharacterized protein n=1 Tax=Mycobacterium conspicuum TaxID=44010 RepID=A0A7I7YJ68_9MYCO|nr:hypothetical protein MCNS_47520 [Mycobacterium conspicuum]
MRLAAPLVRLVLKRRAAYRSAPVRYANPWGAIRTEMGVPLSGVLAGINDCMPASQRPLNWRSAATAARPATGRAAR